VQQELTPGLGAPQLDCAVVAATDHAGVGVADERGERPAVADERLNEILLAIAGPGLPYFDRAVGRTGEEEALTVVVCVRVLLFERLMCRC
jgi:hypothetical protein